MHSATGCSICGTQREGIFLKILMILSNSKSKSSFWPLLLEKWSKIHKHWWFWLQNIIKIRRKFKNIFHSLVPQINHPVALCHGPILDEKTRSNFGQRNRSRSKL